MQGHPCNVSTLSTHVKNNNSKWASEKQTKTYMNVLAHCFGSKLCIVCTQWIIYSNTYCIFTDALSRQHQTAHIGNATATTVAHNVHLYVCDHTKSTHTSSSPRTDDVRQTGGFVCKTFCSLDVFVPNALCKSIHNTNSLGSLHKHVAHIFAVHILNSHQ